MLRDHWRQWLRSVHSDCQGRRHGETESSGRSEGSSRIARCRIELYVWLKHARAWDEVCFQTDAVGAPQANGEDLGLPPIPYLDTLRWLDAGGRGPKVDTLMGPKLDTLGSKTESST